MNIDFSKDFGTINVYIDEKNYEQDLINCHKIDKMIQSEEWQLLMMAFLQAKEKFDLAVMKVRPQEQSFREVAIHAARLNGFWEAVRLPSKLVDASKKFRGDKLKELEEHSEENINVNA